MGIAAVSSRYRVVADAQAADRKAHLPIAERRSPQRRATVEQLHGAGRRGSPRRHGHGEGQRLTHHTRVLAGSDGYGTYGGGDWRRQDGANSWRSAGVED